MNATPSNDKLSAPVLESASELPISTLGLPAYVCALLENEGFQDVGSLALQIGTDREAILAIRGVGPRTLEKIEAAVENRAAAIIVEQNIQAKEAGETDQVPESKVEPEAKKDVKKKKRRQDKRKEKKGPTKKKVTKSKKGKKAKKKGDKPKKKKAKKRSKKRGKQKKTKKKG
jgi:outer membrane biosynthesis protein TonB